MLTRDQELQPRRATRRGLRRGQGVALVTGAALALAACSNSAASPTGGGSASPAGDVTIAVLAPFTGADAALGPNYQVGCLGAAHEIWTCRCGACLRIDALDLKFILHAGAFVTQEIAGRAELVGPEVVMAHRLLKNDAADLVGHGAYALVTAVAATRFAVPTDRAIPLVARYEHYPPIAAFVFPLR